MNEAHLWELDSELTWLRWGEVSFYNEPLYLHDIERFIKKLNEQNT